MAEDQRPTAANANGGVGTKMLFENERVKVWEMDLEPGDETEFHRHDLDYLLVILEGGRIAALPVAEQTDTRGSSGVVEASVHPGQVFYVERGGAEKARNIGDDRYYEIIIELKD